MMLVLLDVCCQLHFGRINARFVLTALLSTKKWLKFERRNKIEIAMRLVKEKYDFLVVLREISCNSERNIVLDLSIENSLIFLDQVLAKYMLANQRL